MAGPSLRAWMAIALLRVLGGRLRAAHILQAVDGSVAGSVSTLLAVCNVCNSAAEEPDSADLMVCQPCQCMAVLRHFCLSVSASFA
eukprot:scaffold280026_cov14-Prasinocladus_malaysianus.AAC.1